MNILKLSLLLAGLLVLGVSTVFPQEPPARLLADSLSIELVYDELPYTAIRIDYHAGRGVFFILHRTGDVAVFDPRDNSYQTVASGSALAMGEPSGFGISPSGDLFVVGNDRADPWVTGVLKRTSLAEGSNTLLDWAPVAETVAYPLAADFNHLMSALAIGPEGRWIYINSGSRTDHGEIQDNHGAHPGVREVPITSAILRIPADGDGLLIQNNADSLAEKGFLFADGVRNHFDMAVGPDLHLFGVENSGDRDDAEELNWLQEGRHYGFPWRMGTHDTPQQFPDYDPAQDPLINPASSAATLGLFVNDPTYPARPGGVEFTDPIWNAGPDAAEYRSADGMILNASSVGGVVGSFTPHKAPLGLVFDTAEVLAEPYTGDGFVLGWNQSSSSLLGPYEDPGEDLLHLDLSFDSLETRNYRMNVYRIADSFLMPIDAALVDTSLYVMEMRFFGTARIWRIDFPRKIKDPVSGVFTRPAGEIPDNRIVAVYPNPFFDALNVQLATNGREAVTTELIDVTGRIVFSETRRLLAGEHGLRIRIRARTRTRVRGLVSGVYVLRATFGHSSSNRVVCLVR